MRYYFLWAKTITVALIFKATYSLESTSKGNEDVDIFKLLLGLYKINPLKASIVYKTFSDNKLSRGEKLNVFTHSNDKQYTPVQELTESEIDLKTTHPKKEWRHDTGHIETPEYDIENIHTEDFNVTLDSFANKLKPNEQKRKEFNNIFDYLGKLEKYADDPKNNQLPTEISLDIKNNTDHKLLSEDKRQKYKKDVPMGQLGINVLEEPIMNNNLIIDDVIVF